MVDGRKHPAFRQCRANVDHLAQAQLLDHGLQRYSGRDRLARQLIGDGDPGDHLATGIIARGGHGVAAETAPV